VFLEVGGFEPLLGVGGEETLLALRMRDAGWRCVYAPQLIAHHRPSAVRDHTGRRRVLERNRLWTEWLARPRRELTASTTRALANGLGDASGRRGILDAIRGARAVAARRHAVGRSCGALWTELDRHERSGEA
jgi:GT2 family glycosyltransferase